MGALSGFRDQKRLRMGCKADEWKHVPGATGSFRASTRTDIRRARMAYVQGDPHGLPSG